VLEKHLRQRRGELFELKCDLLLYDVTSTYFEGDLEGCVLAKRGYSRDSRPDRPPVCIGLVVTEEGFPLGSEVFAGNTHDSQTVSTSGRLKDEAAAGERLGRRKQQNWRASQAFEVTIRKRAQPRGKQRLEIAWRRQAKFADWSQHADGCYLLRSNLTGVDAATLWKRYLQLTEAEGAFRITKDEWKLRPIWHQKENRVKAHILVCFLAYVLGKTLAGWMRHAGWGDAPRTLIEDLARIKSGDVTLRARSPRGGPERRITRPSPLTSTRPP